MRRHILPAALIAAAVLLVYSNTLSNGFVGDDHVYIESNRFVQDPANLKILANPRYYLGAHEVLAGSRPVYLASLMIDRALWGASPAGYHATSALLHAANAVMLYAVAAALGLPSPIPAVAALLFGLHPLQTEAVDAVSFRADPLAAFFVLAGFWAFLQVRRRKGRIAAVWSAASAALYLLGLLSKEMAVTLPALALALEFFFPEKEGRRRRLALSLACYGSALVAWAGFWAARYRPVAAQAGSGLRAILDRAAATLPTAPGAGSFVLGVGKGHFFKPVWEWTELFGDPSAAFWTMVKALAGYFRLLVWPSPLAVDRAPAIARGPFDGWAILGLAVLVAVALYAALMRRRDPASAFGAAWCLLALLPVSDIVPLYNPVAERYAYLVTAGFALAAASLFARFKRPGIAAAAIALVGFSWFTRARNLAWRDDRTILFASTGAPQSRRTAVLRGGLLEEEGRWDAATKEYESVLRAEPGQLEARIGLCRAYAGAGDAAKAAACYDRALALFPGNPVARFAYAGSLAALGRTDMAVKMYREALRLEPAYVEAWVNLGVLYREAKRYKEARPCYEQALKFAAPGDPVPEYSYAMLLERMGKTSDAASHYEAALRQNPGFESARRRLATLGAVRR